MNKKTKRLLLLTLPYLLMGLYATNLGRAWRLAEGADASKKIMSFVSLVPAAFGRIWPSFHPFDLFIGFCCGAGLRLAVYLRGKNGKKYRHGTEYGSARWGTAKDIEPFMAEKFEDNMQEFVGMSSRAHFKNKYLIPLLQDGKIKMTLPDKPTSRNQKYEKV